MITNFSVNTFFHFQVGWNIKVNRNDTTGLKDLSPQTKDLSHKVTDKGKVMYKKKDFAQDHQGVLKSTTLLTVEENPQTTTSFTIY